MTSASVDLTWLTGYRHRYLRFRNQKNQIFPTLLAEKEHILAIEQLFQRFLLRTFKLSILIGPLHDPVTWYGINYTGTQITQWDFQNKGTCTSPARLSFVLKVPLRNLRPSVIYSVPCDRIVQRAYGL